MKMLLEFDYKKATQAIIYMAKREGGQIGKLKLIKLLYLADRYHIRRYGRPITNDVYFAMRLGPVGSSVKDIAEFSDYLDDEERDYALRFLKRRKENNIVSISDVESDLFSESEVEALKFAYDTFGKISPSRLVEIVHRYPEWDRFRSALQSKETTRAPMSYRDFFKDPSSNINDPFALARDILVASQELYEEDYKIAEYWK